MLHTKKKLLALFSSLMLVCMLALAACSGNAASSDTDAGAASSDNSLSSALDTMSSEAIASEETKPAELFGKPWLVSIVEGNIPKAAPDAKDDLFLSCDYDLIAQHQGETWINATAYSSELKDKTSKAIDQKNTSDHDAAQFRIFHDQAGDIDTLAKIGVSEVKPYIDRIDATKSIAELNAVLAAEDFPFTPFVMATLGTTDMHEKTDVSVYPNFLYFGLENEGAQFYAGADTYEGKEFLKQMALLSNMNTSVDLTELGMSEDEAIKAAETLLEFETAYGKDADYNGKYIKADFGAYAQGVKESIFTLDELCAQCPNIPMREMLTKLGKAGAEKYSALSPQWLRSLNSAWTEENLDTIKLMAKAKIMAETRPYRDPTPYNNMLKQYGMPETDVDTFVWNACNSLDTLAQVICKVYVNDVLGQNAKTRLTKLAEDAAADYRELVGATKWLSEESRAKVTEKIDNLAVNVLEPSAGWFDYSGLELKSTADGGTLLSNFLALKQYRYDQEAELVGKSAIGCATWYTINPTMANAFYNSQDNSINLVPGYINSMNYADDMSDSAVMGGIGWTIGHELSHGFDFLGSQVDAYGLGNPIFTEADTTAFLAKCTKISDYYSAMELEPGEMYDGKHVVAEAAADLCGMQVMLDMMGKLDNPDYKEFFAKGAEEYAQTVPQLAYAQLKIDGHPFHYLRVNVNAQMYDSFYDAYGVVEGDGMYLAPDKRIIVWGANA